MSSPNTEGTNAESFRSCTRRLLLGLLCIAGCRDFMWDHGSFSGAPFDQATWHRAIGQNHHSPRGAMLANLRSTHLPWLMSRSQLEQLLGPPDWDRSKSTSEYHVGHCSPLGMIDPDVLTFYFIGDRLIFYEVWPCDADFDQLHNDRLAALP